MYYPFKTCTCSHQIVFILYYKPENFKLINVKFLFKKKIVNNLDLDEKETSCTVFNMYILNLI